MSFFAQALRAIDYDLLLVLFALLVAVELLRDSGALDHAVAFSVRRFKTSRSFTCALIVLSGLLAALVTNDVTLFIVIPFTVVASRFSDFDLEDAVILEVIATNLLGCLTPLGNPQNLFIFHRSGWSAAQFVVVMLPFVAWCLVGLLAALFILPNRPLTVADPHLPSIARRTAFAGAFVFALVLLVIARIGPAGPAAVAAAIAWPLFLRRKVDITIVPLFFVAFIAVEWLRTFAWDLDANVYVTSIALSQVMSNVPAAVLLAPFTTDWRALLYGVSAGGCGTIIASLANLLAWRLYLRESGREPRFFRRLTALNVAFLAWAGVGGWLLLS